MPVITMTLMRTMKSLVPIVAALLLIGGGCAPVAPSTEETTEGTTVDKVADAATNGVIALVTSVQMDDTWQTYVNKALSFEFNWPTRGKYAPQWEVTFVSEGDARIKDGCIAEGEQSKRVKVGEAEFCHSWTDGTAGPTDWYAVKHDSRYAVIRFTKPERVAEGFSLDEYRAHLDQIVSTYKRIE